MTIRNSLKFTVSAALLAFAAPAFAQAGLRVGATVTDQSGGTVGTITAINGPNVTVHTDKYDVPLPATSFTATEDSVLFGMTQAQLDTAYETALAQAQQAFAVGAAVKDRAGAAVGTVQALDAESVTVQMANGVIRLPRNAFAGTANGLVTGATLAELQAHATPASGDATGQ